MSSITYRRRAPADDEQLRDLYLHCRSSTFTWIASERFAREDFDIDTEGEDIHVASIDQRIVAFISTWRPDCFIHHLYVDPSHQGSGIGKHLLDRAMLSVNRPVYLKTPQYNLKAVEFYLHLGWNQVGTGFSERTGRYYLMELR